MLAADYRIIGHNSHGTFLVVLGDSLRQVTALAPLALYETPNIIDGVNDGMNCRFGGTDFIVEKWQPFPKDKYRGRWATLAEVTERVIRQYKALRRERVMNG